ncbi:hypothetical protein ACFYT4_16750 [Streptomyces sp. NPDC004609]|uniref:hypothetical protein n=1 Tax=Streptomyces sp. NPDC004609 TaxID=3364704 RepID=UPI00367A3479
MNPDFELYDNTGRTGEQTTAAHVGRATDDDLLRWAGRDAEPHLARHPLPSGLLAAPDLTPYLTALTAAGTPAEAHAVTATFLTTVEPVLRAVSDYLLAAARWRGQLHGTPKGSPPRLLRDASGLSLAALVTADAAGLDALRAFYEPPPTRRESRSAPGLPPTAPCPPPAPKPGR